DSHVEPRSLYYAQLADRVGEQVWERSFLMPVNGEASSSPSISKAAEMTALATQPAPRLAGWIDSLAICLPISAQVPLETADAGELQAAKKSIYPVPDDRLLK